jgi:murein DD-endopeptidase MepM/ murein hydrolase activator NlpD
VIKVISNDDLEKINQIADYKCREYYEIVLQALIVIVAGVIVGLSIFKIAPTTSPDTKSNNNSETSTENLTPGKWNKPLKNMRLTSTFGVRVHPVLRTRKMHNGADYSAKVGTPTYSINDGIVKRVISDSTCGKGLVIALPGNQSATYCHLSEVKVNTNQKVTSGQIVGLTGNTGRSTGPHLHFGIKSNGQWIDPVSFMQKVGL